MIPPSVFWLIALIVFAVGEALTVGLTSIWFAIGALGALLVSKGPVALQIVVFLVLSGLSLLLVRLGWGQSVDTVTISVLMVLVPGVALTNAMREIMAGDTFSGLSRTADAILVASAIALGAAAGQALGGIF